MGLPDSKRELRELTRHRRNLIQERLQQVLEGANIKLGNVLGVSGRAMLASLAQGEEDPKALADLAQGKLRDKIGELEEALRGVMGPHQRYLLSRLLRHFSFLDEEIDALSEEVKRLWADALPRYATVIPTATESRPSLIGANRGRRDQVIVAASLGAIATDGWGSRILTGLPGSGPAYAIIPTG